MAKPIEMNIKEDSGYDVLWPQTRQELVINLLNSDTKTFLGLDQDATADDAFRKVAMANMLNGKAYFEVQVTVDGTNVSQLKFTSDNFCDSAGTKTPELETNEEGKLIGFCDIANPTVNLSGYADIQEYTGTLDIPTLGEMYNGLTLPLTSRNFIKYTSSGSCVFSNNVNSVDITLVGGGGGGGGSSSSYYWGGAGGGGGYCNVYPSFSFTPNISNSFTIGAGGASRNGTTQAGGNGGNTSFGGNVYVAGGGHGGEGNNSEEDETLIKGGEGNGKGGDGAYLNSGDNDGKPGTNQGYSSFTETVAYGGGGGGGYGRNDSYSDYNSNSGEGAGYGGKGGSNGTVKGENGQNGFGGGGGGGTSYNGASGGYPSAASGKGGSGCVAIRMHLKSAS